MDGQVFNEGDLLSIDGTIGAVYAGEIKTAPSEIIAGLIHGERPRKRPRSSRTSTSS